MRSLGTSNRAEAEQLSRLEGVRLDDEFARHRAPSPASSGTSESPTAEITANTPQLFATDVVAQYGRSPTPIAFHTKMELRSRRSAASSCDSLKEFMARCREEYAYHESILSGEITPVWALDAHEGVRTGFKAFLTGEGNSGITAGFVERHSASKPSNSRTSPSEAVMLGTLLDKWATERKPHGKTIEMTNRTIQRFIEHVGSIAIQNITRKDVVKFKDKLLEMGQSPININKQLIVINTLLNYARDNALIDTNCASGVSVKISVREKPRTAFDTNALNAIFSSPVFIENSRPAGGAGEAAYWLPLLALFTGARLEELGQLNPSDVYRESYLDEGASEQTSWVIRIKNSKADGQEVKNLSSVRRVPIHPELEKLGFIDYVDTVRDHKRIFNQLVADRFGTETAQFSKWFGRYLRLQCGVETKRMTFHSFRHTFKDLCRVAEIPTEVHHALTGHISGNVGDSYGADSYPLRALTNAIARIKIPTTLIANLRS